MNVRDELKAYYDNELSPAQAEQVREALLNDPEAAREYEDVSALSQILRTEAVQPEVRWKEATLAKLEKLEERVRSPWSKPITWIGASCATVLACLVLFPVFAQSKQAAKRTMEDVASSTPSAAATMKAESMPQMDASIDGRQIVTGGELSKAMPAEGMGGAGGFSNGLERGQTRNRSEVASSAAPADSAVQMESLVVKNGNLTIEVASLGSAQNAVEQVVRGARGLIQNANKQIIPEGPSSMTLTARVPASRFESTVQQFRKLGRVLGESMSGDDVTAQVADVDARLRTLRAEEKQFQVLLGRANRIGEVIQVREKIGEVRQEIESLDAQQRTMRNQAKMSTIELSLQEKPKSVPKPPVLKKSSWNEEAWSSATGAFMSLAQALGVLGINLLVFSPIWLSLGLFGWLIARRR